MGDSAGRNFQIRPLTHHDAHQVAAWRYDGRWSVYDLPTEPSFLDDLADYFAVTEGERLVGFCCVGDAARIPGLNPQPGTVDVGLGMDPELVGHGRGVAFGGAVLAYLAEAHSDKQFRAVVKRGTNAAVVSRAYSGSRMPAG